MFLKKSEKISFVSTVEGLDSIDICLPKPAKYFIPQWFKDIPSNIKNTVKDCPSFPDYFSQGYIIPMWTDTMLHYNEKEQTWNWKTASDSFTMSIHTKNQLLDYTNSSFLGSNGDFVFKTICPWKIITPPGWSVLQLPLFYHFNQEWSVLPGVIDTDIHHEVNQQVLYHGNNIPVTINCGDPFVLYVPFKRSNKLKHEIRYQTKKDEKIFKKQFLSITNSFLPNGSYRKHQRERDKKINEK